MSSDHTDDQAPSTGIMLDQLNCLLEQLEDANGGPDSEARQALHRLQASLEALEEAKAGTLDPSAIPQPMQAPTTTTSVPQQLEVLQSRVGSLEQRIQDLSPETQQIIGLAAGDWVKLCQTEAVNGNGNGGGAAETEEEVLSSGNENSAPENIILVDSNGTGYDDDGSVPPPSSQ